jgi:hypothetical protein
VGHPSRLLSGLLAVHLLTAGGVAAIQAGMIHQTSSVGIQPYRAAGRWLAAHAPPGAVVVQTGWDGFPELFFQDPDSRFLDGFDPVFSYAVDPALFWRWSHLVGEGSWCSQPACTAAADAPQDPAQALAILLHVRFAADYLVIVGPWPCPQFKALVRDRRFFEPLFHALQCTVYRVLPLKRSRRPLIRLN